jgi:hypothetical protein
VQCGDLALVKFQLSFSWLPSKIHQLTRHNRPCPSSLLFFSLLTSGAHPGGLSHPSPPPRHPVNRSNALFPSLGSLVLRTLASSIPHNRDETSVSALARSYCLVFPALTYERRAAGGDVPVALLHSSIVVHLASDTHYLKSSLVRSQNGGKPA